MSEGEGGMSQGRFLLRLSLAFFGSFLAAGTLGSWSTFSSLLTGADVFADSSCMTLPPGKCSSQNERLQLLYYVTMGAQNIFSIPSGILFDQQGETDVGKRSDLDLMISQFDFNFVYMFFSQLFKARALLE